MLEQTQDSEEIIARVAALDIGKAEVMCCVRMPDQAHPGTRLQDVRPYSTMTRSLLTLADRLAGPGVTRVVMESTSDYWKPVSSLLEAHGFETALAQLARASMRRKISRLAEAFTGYFTDHHAFLLSTMPARVDAATSDIARVYARTEELIAPFVTVVDRLDEITGVGRRTAQVPIAEIGLDMTRFPTPGHLCSWATFASGVSES